MTASDVREPEARPGQVWASQDHSRYWATTAGRDGTIVWWTTDSSGGMTKVGAIPAGRPERKPSGAVLLLSGDDTVLPLDAPGGEA